MKGFLKDVQRESNEFREDAIRIEQMQRELTTEYRNLRSTATTKVFITERPKSPPRRRDSLSPRSARTMPISRDYRSNSQDFRISSPKTLNRKNFLLTQSTDTFRERSMPHKSTPQKKEIFDINSIPDASIKKNRPPPTPIRLPSRLDDI